MDQRLQQAIDAARSGATDEAQRLLTQVLKDDPDQVQAWFLLSHLVDSETKQAAFLQKVLALDPNHAQARQRLAYIRREAPATSEADKEITPAISISDEGLGMEDQATGETLPSWMTDAEAAEVVDTAAMVAADHGDTVEEELEEEPLPDWLLPKPEVTDDEPEAVEVAAEVEKTLPVKTPVAAKSEAPKKSSSSWNVLLIFLVIVAIVIFYFLIQAALPMF